MAIKLPNDSKSYNLRLNDRILFYLIIVFVNLILENLILNKKPNQMAIFVFAFPNLHLLNYINYLTFPPKIELDIFNYIRQQICSHTLRQKFLQYSELI